MAFPPSMALPPPNPITTSHPRSRNSATPCLTRSTVGSPSMGNRTVSSPESAPAQRDGSAPVTTNARDPNDRAIAGSCDAVPGPNTRRAAVANSNCTLPALVRRVHVGILHAGARLGHHPGDGVAPLRVMRRLFMLRRSIGRAIHLHEHEARRVI